MARRRTALYALTFVLAALTVCIPAAHAAGAAQTAAAGAGRGRLVAMVRDAAHPLTGEASDYDPLMEVVGDSRFVLLGEASHGTHEFYRERARITRRLVEEKGFNVVAIEGDWPNAYRVDRYVRGEGGDGTAAQALGEFDEFPLWMWRNTDVRDLVEWMRTRNASLPGGRPVRFFGLDLYSLFESADAVVEYLEGVDPGAAERARQRYACFERFRPDPSAYGLAAATGQTASCEGEAQRQYAEMRDRAEATGADADLLWAFQNARVVKNAVEYYRTAHLSNAGGWNARDRHMAETVRGLDEFFDAHGLGPAKIVVWAHNTHVGDMRATQMGSEGQVNLGQLLRERYSEGLVTLVGFTTYTGTVMAASEWGLPGETKNVNASLKGSYGQLFHRTGIPAFLLVLRGAGELEQRLARTRLERAIGVVYLPQTERQSHYFTAQLSRQFDAVIHVDVTRAVEPLGQAAAGAVGQGR